MNLVIRQYLACLRERGELDAILPDLLSQMGLTVFSRPRRGTRQDGVDVGAVGSIDGGEEMVYLFSIKAGDLTRAEWDGNAQALRASLNAILGPYVRNRLPVEHRGKRIVVCVCLGGDVREEVRPDLVAYFEEQQTDLISFAEWNGDKLAKEIQRSFLREELLPQGARSNLRKALALLDQPESAFGHFAALVRSLIPAPDTAQAAKVTAIRQLSLCLRILFAWCRDTGNTEAAYRAGELTLLQGWTIFKEFAAEETKAAESVRDAFLSIYDAYQEICGNFLRSVVVPYADTPHGLSTAVRGSCSLDVNLRLFDVLGRVGVTGLWTHWTASRTSDEQGAERSALLEEARALRQVLKAMVANNPILLSPATEDQSIDLGIAFLFLATDRAEDAHLSDWLQGIFGRTAFALRSHGHYPCTFRVYGELLEHPRRRDEEYRREATAGSVLFPLIAVWAALLKDSELYREIALLKEEVLGHCTFQYWFPDGASEELLYSDEGPHGATLTDLCVDRPEADLLEQVFSECDASPHFEGLSAVQYNWWPLVVVACRHHRLPVPLHFLRGLRSKEQGATAEGVPGEASTR